MSDESFNGWVNRETWAAALHLANTEGVYRFMCELVAGVDHGHGRESVAAADAIERFVTEVVEQQLFEPDFDDEWVRMLIADVGSFWRVDWRAVADSFRDQ